MNQPEIDETEWKELGTSFAKVDAALLGPETPSFVAYDGGGVARAGINLEDHDASGGKLVLRGWLFGARDIVFLCNGVVHPSRLVRSSRDDVLSAFPEASETTVFGFELVVDNPPPGSSYELSCLEWVDTPGTAKDFVLALNEEMRLEDFVSEAIDFLPEEEEAADEPSAAGEGLAARGDEPCETGEEAAAVAEEAPEISFEASAFALEAVEAAEDEQDVPAADGAEGPVRGDVEEDETKDEDAGGPSAPKSDLFANLAEGLVVADLEEPELPEQQLREPEPASIPLVRLRRQDARLPKRSDEVLIVGSAPTIEIYASEIEAFDGEIWALNDAWFWLESQGVAVDKVFVCDSRFIKKAHRKIEHALCPTIVATDNVELDLIQHVEKDLFILESLGRDGFSPTYGQVFHGCSVFFSAAQTAFALKYKRIYVCGTLFSPPGQYSRIDKSKTMPEYVHHIQLNNARKLLKAFRKIDLKIEVFEPESNLNYL